MNLGFWLSTIPPINKRSGSAINETETVSQVYKCRKTNNLKIKQKWIGLTGFPLNTSTRMTMRTSLWRAVQQGFRGREATEMHEHQHSDLTMTRQGPGSWDAPQ